MENLGLLEESNAFRYAILSTKVSQILSKIQHGKTPSELDCGTLGRGADLLKQIIEGSILISRKSEMNGFSASQEGLLAYGHALTHDALSAIERIAQFKKNKDLTEVFIFLYNELLSLSKGNQSTKKEVVEALAKFFNILSKLFCADLQKDSFYTSKEPSSLMHSRRSAFYAHT